jgi:hypothetical protein
MTLNGRTAYLAAPGKVTAVDLATGKTTWTATAKNTGADGASVDAPLLATNSGRQVVVTASAITIQGQGTTPSTQAVEVLGVDATTGNTTFDDVLQAPAGDENFSGSSKVTLVGADDHSVVVAASQNGSSYFGPTTLVGDLTTRRMRWSRKGYGAVAFTSGTVIGVRGGESEQQRLLGLKAADQSTAWTAADVSYGLNATALAPGVVLASGRYYGNGQGPAWGRPVKTASCSGRGRPR